MDRYGSPGREGIPESPNSASDMVESVEHLIYCAGEEVEVDDQFEIENPNTPLSEAIFHQIQKI